MPPEVSCAKGREGRPVAADTLRHFSSFRNTFAFSTYSFHPLLHPLLHPPPVGACGGRRRPGPLEGVEGPSSLERQDGRETCPGGAGPRIARPVNISTTRFTDRGGLCLCTRRTHATPEVSGRAVRTLSWSNCSHGIESGRHRLATPVTGRTPPPGQTWVLQKRTEGRRDWERLETQRDQ